MERLNGKRKMAIKKYKKALIPFLIGVILAIVLYLIVRWCGFLILFPWIGAAISIAIFLQLKLKGKNRLLGRKICILMIMPALLIFVPVFNNENFQLEGVGLIVLVGFFNKGFIHYMIAKISGPLIWRRGFCGYACWTAAILDWLPIISKNNNINRLYRNIRYVTLIISIAIPVYMVFGLAYDPWENYINVMEMKWMFVSNGIYYLLAIPLAFILKDKRAFCKYLCPVSLVMKPASFFSLIKVKPDKSVKCKECSMCNKACPMGVDIMGYMRENKNVLDTECILCGDCKIACPVGKIL